MHNSIENRLQGHLNILSDVSSAVVILKQVEADYAHLLGAIEKQREDQLNHIADLRNSLPSGPGRRDRLEREGNLVHELAHRGAVCVSNLDKVALALSVLEDVRHV